jgi:hypothetical protein
MTQVPSVIPTQIRSTNCLLTCLCQQLSTTKCSSRMAKIENGQFPISMKVLRSIWSMSMMSFSKKLMNRGPLRGSRSNLCQSLLKNKLINAPVAAVRNFVKNVRVKKNTVRISQKARQKRLSVPLTMRLLW